MRVELKFNKEIHRSQLEVFMDEAFKPGLKKTYKTFAVGLILIAVSSYEFFLSNRTDVFFACISLALGTHYLIQCINHFHLVYKTKKDYREKIEKDIVRMDQTDQLIIMEFTEEHFYYKELDYNSQIKWCMFQSFRIVEDNIFIDMNRGVQTSYIINESYVGEEKYQEILEFVSKHIDLEGKSEQKGKVKTNPELIDESITLD